MSVLLIIERDKTQLSSASLSAITAAAQWGQPIQALLAGSHCQSAIETLQSIAGVTEILVAEQDCYEHGLAEAWAPLIQRVAQSQSVSHIVAAATTFGKNILPRAAALLDAAQVSDVIRILDADTYQRPIYAGNAIETVRSRSAMQVVTIRPAAFAPAAQGEKNATPVTALTFTVDQQQSTFVGMQRQTVERPDLNTAEIVIAGGRGLGDRATFERLTAIADRLHAAIGASRAAVDAGLAPNDWQVGQTGKIVAPKLYIALGISGAIQHLAGMKDSQVIVAINKDPDAPIFQIADYGLVADIPSVLDEWESMLK
jgi:electron transfer flavoprotein alpha subunit